MKRTGIFTVAFAIMLSAFAASPKVSANGKLDQVLSNMQKNAAGITSLKARMRQEKRSQALGGKETYGGTLYFKRLGKGNDKVRIDYDGSGQVVAVDGDKITLYQPRINQVIYTTKSAQAGKNQEFSFIATPYSSIPELKSRFNVTLRGQEPVDGATTSVLELTPKGASAAQKVVLWVNESTWFPVRYEVTEKNGDVSTFHLSDLRQKIVIPDGFFKVKVKGGTKEIVK